MSKMDDITAPVLQKLQMGKDGGNTQVPPLLLSNVLKQDKGTLPLPLPPSILPAPPSPRQEMQQRLSGTPRITNHSKINGVGFSFGTSEYGQVINVPFAELDDMDFDAKEFINRDVPIIVSVKGTILFFYHTTF